MRTFMVTGSTQGLGLQIVKKLAKLPQVRVIMAVRNLAKGQEIANQLGQNVSATYLDLSSLVKVKAFTDSWKTKLDGLVNNAGIQLYDADKFTAENIEETIAVNHLAAFQLTVGLESQLAGGRVLFIGSGTHHPTAAKAFGFRGAQFTSIAELAEGKSSTEDIMQSNKDRYATSKFLNMVTTVELARRSKSYQVFTLDPGLMPGTGLARAQGGLNQFIWKHILPLIGPMIPGASNPNRSASAATWIMTNQKDSFVSGTIFNYTKKQDSIVWKEEVYNPTVGTNVYNQTVQFLDNFLVEVKRLAL